MTPTQVAGTIAKAAGGYGTCALRAGGTDYPCTAFVGTFTSSALMGNLVSFGDRHVYLAAADAPFEPTMEMQFIDATGAVLRMMNKPAPVAPAGQPLLWELHCRA
jgi:hypothetical protein